MSDSDLLASYRNYFIDDDKLGPTEESETITLHKTKFRLYLTGSAILGAILAFILLLSSGTARNLLPTSTAKNELAGEVALSADQLVALVKKQNVTAYWTGPTAGASYSLTITADKQVFIKYLPGGQGLSDLKPNYRVIATYPEESAYDITRAAGTQSTAISFVNADGGAVYYSKDRATNVYVAYAGIASEIEIFDPDAATALSLGTTAGAVVKVQ